MHTADSLGRTPETGSIAKKLSCSKNNKRDKDTRHKNPKPETGCHYRPLA